jgi:nucleoside-diphosphate-sugar epimerase
MRVYVAGATGVIGQFLVPGLIAAGHEVTASTRSPAKAGQLTAQGAKPVVVGGVTRGAPGIYNIVDDEPAPVAQWLPYLALSAGVKPPMRAPAWLGRLLGGEMVVSMMTQVCGASNEKAKRELGWTPAYPSWRDGFPVWAETFKAEHAAAA